MPRQVYSYSTTTASRCVAQGTSSAFSSSADPDEDWTKISDLAERRRIQNRIAQRNYRKKLRRRLEALERRPGSSSASLPQENIGIQQSQHRANETSQQYEESPESRQQQLSPRLLPTQYTTPMNSDDDVMFSQGYDKDGSRTPPIFASYTYSPKDVIYPAYSQSQQDRPVLSSSDWPIPESDYLAPVTLPSMIDFHDLIKQEHEDTMSPFNMSYQGLSAIDNGHHGHGHSNAHTPPLPHSYDHSTNEFEVRTLIPNDTIFETQILTSRIP